MKKKIIYSSVIAALWSVSSISLAGGPEILPEPDYFSGLYIGGIGGVHHNLFKGSSSVNLSNPINILISTEGDPELVELVAPGTVETVDIGGGEFDGYGGAQGGFGVELNHQFYVGLQGFGEWGSSSETATETIAGSVDNVPVILVTSFLGDTLNIAGTATATTTMKIGNDYGVAGKFGWVVSPRSMIYGKVGASWADIKVSNTTSLSTSIATFDAGAPTVILSQGNSFLSASSYDEQSKVGLLLAVGLEQFVYRDMLSVNVEYTYVNYGHVTTTTPDLAGTFTVATSAIPVLVPGTYSATSNITGQSTASVVTNSLIAGVNFYFGRNWF